MPRFALTLALDGRGFNGTQVQGKGERTVAPVVASALAALADPGAQHEPAVKLSSRLDAGVSAEGLVAEVALDRGWPPVALAHALNQRLPADVACTAAALVPDDFDAIRWAVAKTYRFTVRVRAVRPVLDQRCWWVRRLDHPELLPGLAAHLVGHHDLSGFAALRHDGRDGNDPHRTIHRAEWTVATDGEGRVLTFRISGSGFLYRQVRGLVGAMVFTAQDRGATPADFQAAIAAGRSARRIGKTAPPDGLVLERVEYGEREPPWQRATG
ncbi:tRNA pseudouridine synthase A [Planctomycetota bacterium]|nr:tRNA pseudouridine synthase A [Planctomycetota bacterium]